MRAATSAPLVPAGLLGFAVLVWLVLVAAPATAQVVQPDGMTIPVDSMNGETQLFTFFSGRGEAIDYVNDARQTPSTFSPLCDFTASFVLNEAGLRFGVGWYNADPGATSPPSPSEIYEVVPAGAALGTTISGASIRDDTRYAGGLIGFALMRSPPHFTESRWNTVCDQGPCSGSPGPWVLSLTYASTLTPNAFYIAFEDGDTTRSSWNNDGDYNDDVFFFTGIACAGAGEVCAVDGAEGVCANGLTECQTGGTLTCRQVNSAGDEACDALDNDCDGSTDEGDALCAAGQVCDRGVCVGRCFEGGCASNQTCTEGFCVETACRELTCPAGQRCEAGECRAACEGVVCPGDLVCRLGACIDACAGVSCGDGRVCEGGVCVEPCDCRGCPDGLDCGPAGRCVEAGCGAVSCASGEVCRAGACVDACAGAACPAGQVCRAGACAAPVLPDAGPPSRDAGAGRDAGARADGGAGADGGGGTLTDAGSGGAMDAGRGSSTDGGCGCRVAACSEAPVGAGGLLVAVGLVAMRRRR